MRLTANELALLKQHGFQWYKNHTTDRVTEDSIKDVVPAANGFTVIYNNIPPIVLYASTATVLKIEWPDDLEKQWIRVHWDAIADDRYSTEELAVRDIPYYYEQTRQFLPTSVIYDNARRKLTEYYVAMTGNRADDAMWDWAKNLTMTPAKR